MSGRAILGTLVPEVLAAARRRGHSVVLYVDDRDARSLRSRFDADQVILRPLAFRVRLLTFLTGLARQARRDGIDVLFSHGLTAPGPFRRVVYIYDVLYERFPAWFTLSERLLFRWIRWSARRADVVVALSEFTRRELVHYSYAPRHRIRVIYPGVPHRPEAAETGAPPRVDRPYFLYVGRLNARKNIRLLLDAAVPLLREHPGLSIALVGQRDGRQDALAVPADVAPRVRFLGWQPDDALPRLYRECEAVVYPSYAEGFGLPVLEALQYGAPVIASRGSALEEAVGDAGLQVSPHNADELRQAMSQLLSHPEEAAALRARAAAQLSRFSWKTAAERVIDACELAARDR